MSRRFFAPGFARWPGLTPHAPNKGGAYTVERFIADMTADGQWATLDAAYVFDPGTGAYEDLTANNRDLTVSGTVTQVAGRGVVGDGATGRLLGLGAVNALLNAAQNDVAVTVMVTRAGNQIAQLGRSGASGQFLIAAGPLEIGARLHAASAASINIENSVGATTVWRDPAEVGQVHFAKDDAYRGKVASTSVAPNTNVLALLNSNTGYSTDTVFAAMIGKGVTEAQALRRNGWLNRLARSRGWRPIPPIQQLGLINPISVSVHPDGTAVGSRTGKGPTVTGLAKFRAGFVVGIDGRGLWNDTTFDCAIRVYDDYSSAATFRDYPLAEPGSALKAHFDGLGLSTAQTSVQGVAGLSSDVVGFIAVDTTGTNTRYVRATFTGDVITGVTSVALSGANALAYDPIVDRIAVSGSFISWRDPATAATVGRPDGAAQTQDLLGSIDHITITDDGQWMLLTGGDNNAPGTVTIYSLVNEWGTPIPVRQAQLAKAFATEGPCIVGGLMYLNSDQGFHVPTLPDGAPEPDENQLQVYPTTGFFDPF